jgi:hypothetical protein
LDFGSWLRVPLVGGGLPMVMLFFRGAINLWRRPARIYKLAWTNHGTNGIGQTKSRLVAVGAVGLLIGRLLFDF